MSFKAYYWQGGPRGGRWRKWGGSFFGPLRYIFPFPLIGVTRILILTCVAIHIAFLISLHIAPRLTVEVYSIMALSLEGLLHGFIWEPITHMFLHSLTNIWHLLLNMFGLYILGTPVERAIGAQRYIRLYFISGLVGALFYLVWGLIASTYYIPAVGASGAIMGILTAFALLYPEARLYFFFAIPMRAKQLIPLSIGMEIFFAFAHTNIAWQVHLGGMLGGFLYIRRPWRPAYIYGLRLRWQRIKSLLFGPRHPRYPY